MKKAISVLTILSLSIYLFWPKKSPALIEKETLHSAVIIESSTIKDMDQYKKENTLFLYDIDNTLIKPTQTLGSDQWFYYRFKKVLLSEKNQKKALDKVLTEWTSIQHITQIEEVEKNSSQVIKSQQKDKIRMIGFTTRGASFAQITKQQLEAINVDFSHTSPVSQHHFFRDNKSILCQHGVLFTDGTHKGRTLFKFLDDLNLRPSQIVFINDKKSNLQEVKETCEKRKVNFVGLRFYYLDNWVNSFNPRVAQKQLEAYHKVLSDKEAEALLVETAIKS